MPNLATADDAKRFVQRFYDWYVPYSASHGAVLAAARPEMQAAVAPDLLRVLTEDYDAQSKNRDEIVGLDGDPVTNSQDPCPSYEAVRGRQTGDTYWVDVRHAPACEPHQEVDVTVQLTCSAPSTCSIFNFQYPGPSPSDLRSLLKALREERARPARGKRPRSHDPSKE